MFLQMKQLLVQTQQYKHIKIKMLYLPATRDVSHMGDIATTLRRVQRNITKRMINPSVIVHDQWQCWFIIQVPLLYKYFSSMFSHSSFFG